MRSGPVVLALMTSLASFVATAAADPRSPAPATSPAPAASPAPATSPASPASDPQPITRTPTVQPFLVFDPPPPLVPSLRLEALRIAGERADNDWRYPEPGPVLGFDDGRWFMGYGHYRPRTKRSAA